jgi:hypothetical protein
VTDTRDTVHPDTDSVPDRLPLNRLAVWSVLSSAVTLFGIGSVLGIVFGVVALNQIAVRRERGRLLAVGGIALGAVTLLISMVVVIQVFVVG